ncbi:MAG: DUF3108 domain-containing protein [Betaproteobacteria bacterium]|nr:DUF3108 domain-containing protein [Betaproteobacteria bacterium]
MPLALIVALAASLGAHALALFVPDIGQAAIPGAPALRAELQALPKAGSPAEIPLPRTRKPPAPKPAETRPNAAPQDDAAPLLNPPQPAGLPGADSPAEAGPAQPAGEQAVAGSRMPARGVIRYRVDRGDQGFELGRSAHEWDLVDGRYRIVSLTETSGLAALLKPLRVELESRGRLTADGLQPESFVIRRNGKTGREQAVFDWGRMRVKSGGEGGDATTQPLLPGTQDLLSFNYQMGFLPHPGANNSLPIANGKKVTTYPLEAVGDEEIEIPAGVFRTLHLRAPGDNTTELWLAYDYLLLPVKIRHTDRHGDRFVQVATEILLSGE